MTLLPTVRIRPDSTIMKEGWVEVLGTDTLPVVSVVPQPGYCAGVGPYEYYKVDVSKLTAEQRARLVPFIAQKWQIPEATVEKLLDEPEHGLPIMASQVDGPAISTRFII